MVRCLTKNKLSRLIAKRNILKHKKTTFALVMTLSLIFSIFILLVGVKDTYTEVFIKEAKSKYPQTDIIISYDEYSPSRLINRRLFLEAYDDVDYALSFFNLQVLTEHNDEKHYLSLFSAQSHEFETFINEDIDISGYDAVITKSYADEYQLSVGDQLSFVILNQEFDYTISLIIDDYSVFTGKSIFVDKVQIFKDVYNLGSLSNLGNVIYISTTNVEGLYDQLLIDENYSRYKIELVIDSNKIDLLVQEFTSLIFVAGIIILISLIIVLDSLFPIALKDILNEKKIIGYLGDKAYFFKRILISQWFYYMTSSIIIGAGIAQLVIYLATKIYGINDIIWIKILSVGISALIIVSYIFIRHLHILRKSMQKMKAFEFIKKYQIIPIILLIAVFIFIKPLSDKYNALIIVGLSIYFSLYAIIAILKYFTGNIYKKQHLFGLIHIKSLYKNKYIHDTLRVLFISFIVITTLITVRTFIAKEIQTLQDDFHLDLMMVNLYDYDESILEDIRAFPLDKADSAVIYQDVDLHIKDKEMISRFFVSIDLHTFQNYFGYELDDVEEKYVTHQFPYVLLPQTYEKVYDIKEGELITINLSKTYQDQTFVVAGFVRSNYDHFIYSNIKDKVIDMDIKPNAVFVITDQKQETSNTLIEAYSSKMYYVIDVKELVNDNLSIARNVLSLFTVLTVFIVGSFFFVVYNQTVLKFEVQKKDYAKIKVLGVDRRQMRTNHLKEWFLLILIIGIIGVIEISILSIYLKDTLLFFDYYKDISTNYFIFISSYVAIGFILWISYKIIESLITKMRLADEFKII